MEALSGLVSSLVPSGSKPLSGCDYLLGALADL
jgi:hypothetical protein